MTRDEELVQAANHVADAWHYGTNPQTRNAPPHIWHVIRDAALKELKRFAPLSAGKE